MFARFLAFCLLVVLTAASAFAIDKNIQNTLRSELKGKTIFLLSPYISNNLTFDAQGKPTKSIPPGALIPGALLIDGAFEAKKISFSADSIKLEGKRAKFVFVPEDEAGMIVKYKDENVETVKIEIFLDSGGMDIVSTRATLAKVITANLADVKNLLPWSCSDGLIQTQNKDEWKCLGKPPASYSLEIEKITMPRVIYAPKPVYTERARQLRISGTVSLLVDIDEKGCPIILAILRPLGGGLTDSAIQTIRKWRWSPALDSDGRPFVFPSVIGTNFILF